jgi:hypothetical protein
MSSQGGAGSEGGKTMSGSSQQNQQQGNSQSMASNAASQATEREGDR